MFLNEQNKINGKEQIQRDLNNQRKQDRHQTIDSDIENLTQSQIPIYMQLYPPSSKNDSSDKLILKKQKKINKNKEGNSSEKSEEKYELTQNFLDDLIKEPCPISRNKIQNTISNNIQSSTLVDKLFSEYKSEKKISKGGIVNLFTQYLFYRLLKKNKILYRIGEENKYFYYILSGKIEILKLKDIFVKMTHEQYLKYLIFLINNEEDFILSEVLLFNDKMFNFREKEQIQKLYYVNFCILLIEKIKKHLIPDYYSLKNFFTQFEIDFEVFDLKENELDLYQQKIKRNMRNAVEDYENYVLSKCTPSSNDMDFYEKYENLLKSKNNKNVKCFIYNIEKLLEEKNYFGEIFQNESDYTVRAVEKTVLACIKKDDYLNIIEPKRKVERMKEFTFLHNNFFFNEINGHVFEKRFFDFFVLKEYNKNSFIYKVGDEPKNLILLKEGKLSIEISCSIIDINFLIKSIFNNLINNDLIRKKNILPKEKIILLKNYIKEPIFKNLEKTNPKIVEELKKIQNFQIAVLTGIEILGLEEIFLKTKINMNSRVVDDKILCYKLPSDKINLFLAEEENILIEYSKTAVNKIISTIQRLLTIRKNCIDLAKMKSEFEIKNRITLENDKFKNFSSPKINLPKIQTNVITENNDDSFSDSVNLNGSFFSFYKAKSPIKNSISDNQKLIECMKNNKESIFSKYKSSNSIYKSNPSSVFKSVKKEHDKNIAFLDMIEKRLNKNKYISRNISEKCSIKNLSIPNKKKILLDENNSKTMDTNKNNLNTCENSYNSNNIKNCLNLNNLKSYYLDMNKIDSLRNYPVKITNVNKMIGNKNSLIQQYQINYDNYYTIQNSRPALTDVKEKKEAETENQEQNYLNRNENKLKINDKVKDYYNQIKIRGCLTFLPKKEANTIFKRKFHKKYRKVGLSVGNTINGFK